MKTLQIVALLCAMLFTNAAADIKRYAMESGVMEYKITGGGTMMGMQTSTQGTKTIAFKNWGNIELLDSIETTKIGQQKPQKQHTMMKFENGKVYGVDFDEKVIYIFDMQTSTLMNNNKSYTNFGREMLEKNKAKRLKDEKVLGYVCEVWQMMDSKIWIYKGIALKVLSNTNGISYQEEVTKVEFNTSIPAERFALPKYPTKEVEDTFDESMEGLSDEEKEQLKGLMQGLPISLDSF